MWTTKSKTPIDLLNFPIISYFRCIIPLNLITSHHCQRTLKKYYCFRVETVTSVWQFLRLTQFRLNTEHKIRGNFNLVTYITWTRDKDNPKIIMPVNKKTNQKTLSLTATLRSATDARSLKCLSSLFVWKRSSQLS